MLKSLLCSALVAAAFLAPSAYAGCGGCGGHAQAQATATAENAADLVTAVDEAGVVKGKVLASCGMCSFGMKDQKGCNLAIKVGENTYSVEGSKIKDHGNPHAAGGLCQGVRVAEVSGSVKDKVFKAESFKLADSE